MVKKRFVGRKKELKSLAELHEKQASGLVVVKGRRRIGKSRLIAEFAGQRTQCRFWNFAGLAPQEGLTAQDQRDHFAKQLADKLGQPPCLFHDWSDAFDYLQTQLSPGDIVLLDEISWMGMKDVSFIPKLKAWWDNQVVPVLLVLCGSVSTWIEENILKSTAFFGRVNLTIGLEPLSIPDSVKLLQAMGYQGSSYDIYKLLSVLGGVPWYLEQVSSGYTADSIIKKLCFEKNGLLVLEFDRIFHDLFNGKGSVYKKILSALQDGVRTLSEVRENIGFSHSGTLSKFMDNLVVAGFVEKKSLWSFKTLKPLKKSLYYICDPYMRFYLKVIEPNKNKISLDGFDDASLSSLPGYDSHMGLQLEYLLLQNRRLLLEAMGVDLSAVVSDGPYRQPKTATQPGCQIDYLVQTQTKNLFICEFKFKRRELGADIVRQMKDKITALKTPRGFAALPVLCHLSGVSTPVETDGFFYRIIDMCDLLEIDGE